MQTINPNYRRDKKDIEYPDRRIKAIVYSMTSSGRGLESGMI
jgi:hypothetical protein